MAEGVRLRVARGRTEPLQNEVRTDQHDLVVITRCPRGRAPESFALTDEECRRIVSTTLSKSIEGPRTEPVCAAHRPAPGLRQGHTDRPPLLAHGVRQTAHASRARTRRLEPPRRGFRRHRRCRIQCGSPRNLRGTYRRRPLGGDQSLHGNIPQYALSCAAPWSEDKSRGGMAAGHATRGGAGVVTRYERRQQKPSLSRDPWRIAIASTTTPPSIILANQRSTGAATVRIGAQCIVLKIQDSVLLTSLT